MQRERRGSAEERDTLRRTVRGHYGFDNIIGHAQPMRRVFEQVRLVAKWNTTVLIRGETGTGKELIANAIHYNSPRARGPFVKLNCAALPENLLESELFGHEKGAFTGAMTQRKGRFEQADGGTLFLDEIGEISAAFQAKLLRVLQEGEFERVGGNRTIKVDVRVIAATNRDLEGEVERRPLPRGPVLPPQRHPHLPVPPLRERMEDIPDIARFLVDKIGRQPRPRPERHRRRRARAHAPRAGPATCASWKTAWSAPRCMSEAGTIDRDAILHRRLDDRCPSPVSRGAHPRSTSTTPNLDERERVIAALEEAGWVQAKAARLLGHDPAPDRLPDSDPQHPGAAVLTPGPMAPVGRASARPQRRFQSPTPLRTEVGPTAGSGL